MATPTEEMEWEGEVAKLASTLTPMKQRVVYLYLAGVRNYAELGEMVGLTGNTISRYLADEDVGAVLAEIAVREGRLIAAGLYSLRQKALGRLGELLDARSEKVRLEAVRDVLDRTGHNAERTLNKNVSISYENELLAEVMEVAKEN